MLSKERNLSVDVLRGIGILLVVSGHANSGSALYPFAPYSFHMPLFFFLSGLFFSDVKIENVYHVVQKNLKSLLLYSTAFYLFYYLICQAVHYAGFTQFKESASLNVLLFNQFLSGGAYLFTAAYWFIPCLFFVKLYFSIIHVRVFQLFFSEKEQLGKIFFFAVYGFIACFSVWYSCANESSGLSWSEIPVLRVMFAAFFYYFGCVFSGFGLERFARNVLVMVVLYIAQQQLWVYFGNLDFWMQISKFQDQYTPVPASLIAIIFFYGIASMVSSSNSASAALGYIGKNTMPIVLHHLFGFFILNVILCVFGIIKISDVTGPYYQYDTVHTWPAYIAFGVAYSLAFDRYIFQPAKKHVKSLFARKVSLA